MIAMETLINARRGNRELKPSDEHLLGKIGNWFNSKSSLLSLVENGISLSQCKLQGYLPEDFIEHSITWKKCVKTYTTPALLEFGFRWHHMIQMGFTPDDFKRFDWEELTNTLNIESKDMMKTSIREMGIWLERFSRYRGKCKNTSFDYKKFTRFKNVL